MATYLKQHFHSGPDGAAGILFRTGNFPRSDVFRSLFESTLFKLNASDSATTAIAGHSRIETDVRARTRSLSAGDGWTRFILAHQLPNIIGTVNAEHTLVQAVPYGDLSVVTYDYTHPSGAVRRDFMIYSNLQFISSDGTIDIVGNGAGMYDFKASLGMGDTYKIMLNEFDIVPDYIGNKIDSSLYVTALDKLGVKHDDSQSIQLITSATGIKALLSYAATNSILLQVGAFGLYANLRIADNTLSEDANGVRVTKPCNDINSSDGTITTSYNSLLGTWDIKLASTIGSSGDVWDVQFADGSGGFTHIFAPGPQRFRYDGLNGGVYFGTLLPGTGISGISSLTIGTNQNNDSYCSFMCGQTNDNRGWNNIIYGQGVINEIPYSLVRGYSISSLHHGKGQEASFPMTAQTTNDTLTQLALMDSTLAIVLPDNTAWRVEVDVIATEEGEAVSAIWDKITFGLRRHDGNLEFIGSPSVTSVTPSDNDFLSDPEITIDIPFGPVTDAFIIQVKGLHATTINWAAIVRYISIWTGEPNESSSSV